MISILWRQDAAALKAIQKLIGRPYADGSQLTVLGGERGGRGGGYSTEAVPGQ